MLPLIHLSKVLRVVILCMVLISSCRKVDQQPPQGPGPGKPTGSLHADTISGHLRFFNASKRQGNSPAASTGSSLKISFKDTLYLLGQVKMPIKFLHDITKNVTGVYLQVGSVTGISSYYFDVPEVRDMAESDTVSVIMIGIDPTGLDLPQTFDITITPHDKTGQPLGQTRKPVKLDKPNTNADGNGGSCGVILPKGEYWDWEFSYILDNTNASDFSFYNQPGKVFSGQGQDIEGSCCNGFSKWPGFCAGEKKHNQKLHFSTYYKIDFETLRFFSGGGFFRGTLEDSPVPLPDESNFCGGGSGKVRESIKHTLYEGEWTITKTNLPPDLQYLADTDTLLLSMRGTSTTGTGFGNPGGVIHGINCRRDGYLVLIQLDREGAKKHLFKKYTRRIEGEPKWYEPT